MGCAGWSLSREHKPRFPEEGTHLQRYAQRLPAAEINSSFYRPHRTSVYAKWADSVPEGFRFAVKVPKAITHVGRLVEAEAALDTFVAEAAGLGEKLGCLLVQLPPSLALNADTANRFFGALRERTRVDVACEPRHRTWFDADADALLVSHAVARVAADPLVGTTETGPGGFPEVRYHRLHGSPKVYYSNYDDAQLDALAVRLRQDVADGARVWCIFDNTAEGAATFNALDVMVRLGRSLEG